MMVASAGTAAVSLFTQIAPFLPTIGKFALGMLPPNASTVVGQVVDTVKQGISIATPVLNTLGNIHANASGAPPGSPGADISLAEMDAALMALKTPGEYEKAIEAAKEKPQG